MSTGLPRPRYVQPPIHFGGAQLPGIVHVDVRELQGEALTYAAEHLHREPLPHCNPPAGEATPEARLVNVSRMSLAARIKHGVPLAELLPHITTLAEVEQHLIQREEVT